MSDRPAGVLIVGAGPRLGTAFARRLAGGCTGRSVGLIGRSPRSVGAVRDALTADDIDAHVAVADVADAEALAAAVTDLAQRTGGFDVAIHNVSVWRDGGATELAAPDLLADLAAGAASLLTMTAVLVPAMRARGGGTILATGSVAADEPTPGAPSLGVQKAALRTLVRGLAGELAPQGIHCATVTIRGVLGQAGFDPAGIADVYADLVAETDRDRETWRTVVDFNGAP